MNLDEMEAAHLFRLGSAVARQRLAAYVGTSIAFVGVLVHLGVAALLFGCCRAVPDGASPASTWCAGMLFHARFARRGCFNVKLIT